MLRFIEQYDANDMSSNAASQPYAYVADIVEEIKLGIDVEDVRGKGVNNDQWTAMMELRDKLAPEGKVGWYVVVCGDEERWAPPKEDEVHSTGHNSVPGGSETDSTYYTNKPATEISVRNVKWMTVCICTDSCTRSSQPRPSTRSLEDSASSFGERGEFDDFHVAEYC